MTTAEASSGRRRHWPRIALGTLAGLALAAALPWLVLRCSADFRGPVPLHTYVPQDAAAVAWIEELGAAVGAFDAFGRAVPGTAGLVDALAVAAGLDPRDDDAMALAGLRSDAGAVAFAWREAQWLILPVLGERGALHVVDVLRRRGNGVAELPGPATPATVAFEVRDRVDPARAIGRLWHVPPVVVVGFGQLTDDALPALVAARSKAAFPGRAGLAHADAQLDQGLRQAVRNRMGPAAMVLGGAVDRVRRVEADLAVGPAQARLTVRLAADQGALADVAQYHAGFVPPDAAAWLDLGDLLPDETMALVRARLNPALLQLVPAAVRDQVISASALMVVHPALVGVDARSSLVAELDGQLAVALLAVADEVPLDPNRLAEVGWRRALRIAIAGSLRTDVAARALIDRCQSALATSADRPETVALGRWTGFAVAGPEVPWLLLRDGRKVAFVSGAGAREDLERVAQGKFPPLGKVAGGGMAQAVVRGGLAGPALWLGAHVETPRVARSLRRRGVPDYAVQMVAGIARATATLTLDDAGMTATVEVHPSAATALAPGPSPAAAGGSVP